jgi:hypothetical protein
VREGWTALSSVETGGLGRMEIVELDGNRLGGEYGEVAWYAHPLVLVHILFIDIRTPIVRTSSQETLPPPIPRPPPSILSTTLRRYTPTPEISYIPDSSLLSWNLHLIHHMLVRTHLQTEVLREGRSSLSSSLAKHSLGSSTSSRRPCTVRRARVSGPSITSTASCNGKNVELKPLKHPRRRGDAN